MAQTKPAKPLKLNELLIQNVNTWGNVQYNIPLRLSNTETRSGTSIGHRFIPAIPHSLDCVSIRGHRYNASLTSATIGCNNQLGGWPTLSEQL